MLEYRQDVKQYPNNGEFWGQLGKAIKKAISRTKGDLRGDPAGEKLYQEAFDAYQKSVQLLPKDALWHYGFADLIWSNYYFDMNDWHTPVGEMEIAQIADELSQSLALEPENAQARALADRIAEFDFKTLYIRKKADGGYDFPVLTATPTMIPPTGTPTPPATSTPQTVALAAATDAPVSPTKTPETGLPLCGAALPAALMVFWLAAKKKKPLI